MNAAPLLQDAPQPTAPFDSAWATTTVPAATPDGLEAVMLSQDKLYVVLAVVLIIWLGIIFLIFRTDRRIRSLEERLEHGLPEQEIP